MTFGISKVTTAIKNNYGKYLAKAAGATAIALVASDAHVMGKLTADTYAQQKEADRASSAAHNMRYLSEPSTVQSNLKKTVFNLEMENNTFKFFNSAIGYFKGLGEMLISGVVPLGLGVTALIASPSKHGKLCKAAGWGLVAYAGVKLVKDILGVGNSNPLNSHFK